MRGLRKAIPNALLVIVTLVTAVFLAAPSRTDAKMLSGVVGGCDKCMEVDKCADVSCGTFGLYVTCPTGTPGQTCTLETEKSACPITGDGCTDYHPGTGSGCVHNP